MQRDFEENSNGISYLQVGGLFDLKDMLSFPANRLLELLSQCGDGNFFEKIVDYIKDSRKGKTLGVFAKDFDKT